MQRSRLYKNGVLVEQDFDLDRVRALKRDKNSFFWIDLVAPTAEQLGILGAELGLNELAIEDALKGRQRTKMEHYDSHLFVNAYTARFVLDEKDGKQTSELASDEIAIFVTSNALITVRDDEGFDVKKLLAKWDESAELTTAGVTYLFWALLDMIVDSYFVVIDHLNEYVEDLEQELFDEETTPTHFQRETYRLRKSLVMLRRVAVPMREVLSPIVRTDPAVLNGKLMPYFQDVYDHVMRVADWTDSLRDLVTTLIETNLTIQSNRMNLVMKKVTSWAAIIAVPTAITGFYGQNVPYPGYDQAWGFWASTGLIVLGGGILYFVFKKKDWL
ncbi:MAG: hypothetical protein RL605_871 [Actinomycetota bacterium]|jgi:magnesium transporter